jgi:hypothetical protein
VVTCGIHAQFPWGVGGQWGESGELTAQGGGHQEADAYSRGQYRTPRGTQRGIGCVELETITGTQPCFWPEKAKLGFKEDGKAACIYEKSL